MALEREMSCLSHGVLSLFKAPQCFGPEKVGPTPSRTLNEYVLRSVAVKRGKPMKRDSNGEQCDHPKSIFARRSSGLLGSRPLGAELESRPGGDKMAPLLGGVVDTGRWKLGCLSPAGGDGASLAWLFCCHFYTTLGTILRMKELSRWEEEGEKRRRIPSVMHRSAGRRSEGCLPFCPCRRRRRPISRGAQSASAAMT